MTHRRRRAVVAAGCAALLALVAPAWASVSMTASPASSVSWNLAPETTNTTSGGTMTINATLAYQVTATADKARLSEWDTGSSAYVADGKTIAAPLNVIAVRTGGTALVPGVGATAVIGTSSLLATGTGGLGGKTDIYSITLSQVTAITDAALPPGRVYRSIVTYTASATL